jgi:hypothetical protein
MATKLKFKPSYTGHLEVYPDDVDRIVLALANAGYEVSPADACLGWEAYSESFCCGWHVLPPSDEELIRNILPYLSEP